MVLYYYFYEDSAIRSRHSGRNQFDEKGFASVRLGQYRSIPPASAGRRDDALLAVLLSHHPSLCGARACGNPNKSLMLVESPDCLRRFNAPQAPLEASRSGTALKADTLIVTTQLLCVDTWKQWLYWGGGGYRV